MRGWSGVEAGYQGRSEAVCLVQPGGHDGTADVVQIARGQKEAPNLARLLGETSIAELLDETAVTKDAPVFERARATTRAADAVVQRFSSVIDVAVQDGNFIEAQQLQLLRMRLIRDYSGLWLLVNRPAST